MINHTEWGFMIDNEPLYDLCPRGLDIERETYTNLSRPIDEVVSSLSASPRFEFQTNLVRFEIQVVSSLNVDFTEFQTNLIPYAFTVHLPRSAPRQVYCLHVVVRR
jgi:tubulin alpha